jgi:hypothetical protein
MKKDDLPLRARRAPRKANNRFIKNREKVRIFKNKQLCELCELGVLGGKKGFILL